MGIKEYYNTGIHSLTLIGNNDGVIDYFAQLDKKDIEFAELVDINTAKLEELTTLPGIEVKTAEKNIIKPNELGRYNT